MDIEGGERTFRLLFIARDRFPPRRVDVEVLFGEELVNRGHKIDWLLQADRQTKRSYRTQWRRGRAWVGANTDERSAVRRMLSKLMETYNDLRMFSLTRNTRYDFILVRDKFVAALFGLLCARLRGTKFVYWLSFPFPEAYAYTAARKLCRYPLLNRIRGWLFYALLYWVILPRATHVFVQSEQMKKDFVAKRVPEMKMTAIPMGVALGAISESPTKETSDLVKGTPVVYLGDLGRIRELDFLIAVHKKVRDEIFDARLYLLGGTEEPGGLAYLKEEIERLGLEDAVEFPGELNRAEAWEYVRAAAVCVSPIPPNPIYNPSSPTKIVEYLAMSKPVVANDLPDQREVISASEGGRCVRWEVDEFAHAIVDLIRNPEEAQRLAKQGRLYIERNRSYDVLARKVERQLLSLLDTGKRMTHHQVGQDTA